MDSYTFSSTIVCNGTGNREPAIYLRKLKPNTAACGINNVTAG